MPFFGKIIAGLLAAAALTACLFLRDSILQAPATALLVGAAVICYELAERQNA